MFLGAALGRGIVSGQESARTPAAPATPAQGTPQDQRQTPATPAQGTQQGQRQTPVAPAQGTPQDQRQTPATPAQGSQGQQTGTAAKARPDLARLIVDVNPLMWILSGIPDENNNRSVFFDIGIQYNMFADTAIRLNPAFSFGFTRETAFSDSPVQFFEITVPLSLLCFPFPKDTYLDVLFFGISVAANYHKTLGSEADRVFLSIGALIEIGYQIKFSNHLSITPSIGVSRMFPKLIEGDVYSVPSFNLYSPWTADTPIAPRARITVGFWV
jgi:hypothetical protein